MHSNFITIIIDTDVMSGPHNWMHVLYVLHDKSSFLFLINGIGGAWTHSLPLAGRAFYQLNYTPLRMHQPGLEPGIDVAQRFVFLSDAKCDAWLPSLLQSVLHAHERLGDHKSKNTIPHCEESRRWDSNPQPSDYKSTALPIEPHRRILCMHFIIVVPRFQILKHCG